MFEIEKENYLNESKTFCMLPWIHIHSTPTGAIFPCCVSIGEPIGHTSKISLKDAFNSPKMKQLRLDMLKGEFNSLCSSCYNHDKEYNNGSLRMLNNEKYEKYFDDLVPFTKDSGAVEKFEMRYIDIRFNNICNFKCRTCSSNYSSRWEKEDLEHKGIKIPEIVEKENNIPLINEAIEHIPFAEEIYFAGGEPLITDEHYILLEEIIRQNKTNIVLRYITNCSTLNYKDKDLISLWKHFDKVNVMCSIDHYGQRAQYIRHGTIWPEIQENFKKIKALPFVETSIFTVLSVYNYLTLTEFYAHLLMEKMLEPGDNLAVISKMNSPEHLSSHVLPAELKKIGRQKILDFIPKLNSSDAWLFPETQTHEFLDAMTFTESRNTWNKYKSKLQEEILNLDRIRMENFVETFPELESLLDGAPKQKPIVV